jgi:hypothetical protein
MTNIEAGQIWYDKGADAFYMILNKTDESYLNLGSRWETVCLSYFRSHNWHVGQRVQLTSYIIKEDQYICMGF